MRREIAVAALAVAAVAAVVLGGCGGCGEEFAPPDVLTRDIPSEGASRGQNNPTYIASYDGGAGAGDAGYFCCTVQFAFRATDLSDVQWVALKGSSHPLSLSTAVAMTSDDAGIWTVSGCLPSSYHGVYFYEVATAGSDPDAGAFIDPFVNPNVPVTSDPVYSTVNQIDFDAVAACSEIDAGMHSNVALSDAGS